MLLRSGEPPCRQLRREIKSLSLPNDPDVHIDRKFFPRSRLERLITTQRIADVLNCSCASCATRVECSTAVDVSRACKTILGYRDSQEHDQRSSVSLFALLVFIECPQFILAFLDRSCNDRELEDQVNGFSTDRLRRSFWPAYDKLQPQDSEGLADEFRWHKYKFAVPHMNSGEFAIYDRAAILPFLDEQPLGRVTDKGEVIQEGAFGMVYSFEILAEYRDLPHTSQVTKFARKELRGIPLAHFEAEKKNLELVKKLEDPHLVRILKAYKHGDAFNLVFPCAKTNLGQFLRDRRYGASELFAESLELNPLWSQMLGIARALDRITNCVLPDEGGGQILYGYHFDLKPANVLVEYSGRWVISDFGQARFKRAGGTSKMTGMGGTEAYAPPEIDQRNVKPNRRYDVWSLGCILVEFCTYLVTGYEGLHRLDNIRITEDQGTHSQDDRFFRRKVGASAHRYELKPHVLDWIRSLPEADTVRNQRSQTFLREVLILAERMLDVDVAQRLTSDLVYSLLSGILRQFQPIQPAQNDSFAEVELPPDEIELGKDIIPEIRTLSCSTSGCWVDGPLRVVESSQHELRLIALRDGQSVRAVLGVRSQTRLLPHYALHALETHDLCAHQNFFSTIEDISPRDTRLTKFYFHQLKDTISMQSVLLGQSIRRTLVLQQVSLERRTHLVQNLRRVVNGSRPQLKDSDLGRALAVQLWSEQSYKDPNARRYIQRKDSPRTAREYFFHGALPRRIVIFFQHAILIVRLAKNARAEKPVSKSGCKSLRIIPTNGLKDSSFTASLLLCDHNSNTPSIPLDRSRFDELEEKGSLECKSLQLVFQVEEDFKAFYRSYKILKDEWSSEEKRLEECRKSMGEVLGWAPD